MTNDIGVPRELLGRKCASNFLGAVWCAEAEWIESKFREIQLIGVEAAMKLSAAAHDHGEEEVEAPPDPLYARVGSVAIVGVDGPLMKHPSSFGGASTVRLRSALRAAAADAEVKSIMMRISSPGGQVDGIGDLGDDMRAIREIKPIVAYAEDVMASGGYWIGAQASRLISSPHARVGSIGVYHRIVDNAGAMEKEGFKVHIVRSTPKKAAGLPPVTEADLKEVQKGVDSTHEAFVNAIALGRRVSFDEAAKWGTGEVWTAKEAQKMGLVDELGSIDHALKVAQSMAGEGKIMAAMRRVGGAEVASEVSVSDPGILMMDASDAVVENAPDDSGKLLKGSAPSSEQATAPEPGPEDTHMANEPEAAPVGTKAAAPPADPPAQPTTTPEVNIDPAEYREMLAFVKEEKDRRAKAHAAALSSARARVSAAHPHMSAESLERLVREPGDADALIESLNGARASVPVEFASLQAQEDEGIPNVSAEIAKRRKEVAR